LVAEVPSIDSPDNSNSDFSLFFKVSSVAPSFIRSVAEVFSWALELSEFSADFGVRVKKGTTT
jgi:hypothetical protein